MAEITLYSTGCPNCKMLAKLLDKQHIQYQVCSDAQKMIELGMSSAPMLEVDGRRMSYKEAQTWAKQYREVVHEEQ